MGQHLMRNIILTCKLQDALRMCITSTRMYKYLFTYIMDNTEYMQKVILKTHQFNRLPFIDNCFTVRELFANIHIRLKHGQYPDTRMILIMVNTSTKRIITSLDQFSAHDIGQNLNPEICIRKRRRIQRPRNSRVLLISKLRNPYQYENVDKWGLKYSNRFFYPSESALSISDTNMFIIIMNTHSKFKVFFRSNTIDETKVENVYSIKRIDPKYIFVINL